MIPKTKMQTTDLLIHQFNEYGVSEMMLIDPRHKCIVVTCEDTFLDLDTFISINSAIASVFPKEEVSNIIISCDHKGYHWGIPCSMKGGEQ